MIWIALIVALGFSAVIAACENADKRHKKEQGQRDETPHTAVSMQTAQHPYEPGRGKPVKDQTEYAPIYSQYFLPPEHQLDLVTLGDDGITNLELGLYNGQLLLEAPNGLLPDAASGQCYKLGIFTGALRGTSYYEKTLRLADTRPLKAATLRREFGNRYDHNAVAIVAPNAGVVGYMNKQNAARLAKRLDTGEPYAAIFTSGCAPGDDSVPASVLIAPTNVMQSIFKNSGVTKTMLTI